jgi:hypothetical protein
MSSDSDNCLLSPAGRRIRIRRTTATGNRPPWRRPYEAARHQFAGGLLLLLQLLTRV